MSHAIDKEAAAAILEEERGTNVILQGDVEHR